MFRVLALCLALLLPLQGAWAAAGEYCQHETTSKGAAHFGHHLHVHKTGSNTTGGDGDCGYCHSGVGSALAINVPMLPSLVIIESYSPLPSLTQRSAPQRVPDRPNWSRLV